VAVLGSGGTVTTNINLVAASRVISGRVVNAANTAVGPPGVVLFTQSENDSYALSSTDTNGVFSIDVTGDVWQVEPQSENLATHGYLGLEDAPAFDASVASVSNAEIPVHYGTAMFYGTIRDDTGAPIPGVQFSSNDSSNQYDGGGESAVNGNYSVPVLAGSWYLSPQNENPGLDGFVVAGSTNATLSAGQAIRVNFLAVRATGIIRGFVRDNLGAPVADISIYNFASINGVNFSGGTHTDSNGDYSLSVVDGVWSVGLSCEGDSGLASRGYNCIGEKMVQVPPSNATADFVVYPLGTPSFGRVWPVGLGYLQILFYGAPGTNYTIQYSTNLSLNSWRTLTVTNLQDNMAYLQDNNATNRNRVYRAIVGP
jgi:hypothetical protein